jgi:hypothetical protein
VLVAACACAGSPAHNVVVIVVVIAVQLAAQRQRATQPLAVVHRSVHLRSLAAKEATRIFSREAGP